MTPVHGTYFTQKILSWNQHSNDRKMPWKGEKDPYKIWLSEIILQQTRVEQGLSYYNKFIQSFPTVHHLAKADDSTVFKLWEGLGYYSRCKNLISSARVISNELRGIFPVKYDEIIKLKGVGTYTAAAIASFAFNEPVAAVDGNVTRILSRFFGIQEDPASTTGKASFIKLASSILPQNQAGIFNQAMMDFGATVCKPFPACDACMLHKKCFAYTNHVVDKLPVKNKKLLKKKRYFNYVIAEKGNSFLVRKRTGKDIWQNLNEFILHESPADELSERNIEARVSELFNGSPFAIVSISKPYKQLLTHQVINSIFIHIRLHERKSIKGYRFESKSMLKQKPFPRIINEYLQDTGLI
jgi:A/G-specific adenine glycosylase